MHHYKRLLLVSIALFSVLCGCREQKQKNEDKTKMTPVKLVLNWFPEAEHGGFYAALVHGYYREQGLDVTIIPGGPGGNVTMQVASETVEFGVTNADRVLLARAQEADVVAVMVPIDKSPRCMIVHADSPAKKLEDLRNMTLFMSSNAAFSLYFRKKIDLRGAKIVPYNGNIAQFLLDKNSAQQAYVFSEPFVAQQKGAATRSLMIAELLDFNPYTSILITRSKLMRQQPELVRKMVIASKKGWLHYRKDAEATNAHIHSVNPEMSMAILRYGANSLHDLMVEDEAQFGLMSQQRWQKLLDQIVEIELVPANVVRATDVFSNQFLQDGR